MECYREAIILNEKMENDQIKVDLFIGIGALYEAQDLLENALVEYRTALALAKKMNNRSRQGVILTNIANVYLQQDEANSALEMLTTAYLIRESLDDHKGMAYVLNLMGMAYEKLGQPDRAKELYISSLKISQTLGNMREVATTLSFMGVNLIKENNYHSAIEYIKTSIQITDSAQMLHELSENYKLMVFSYSAIGLTDSAEWYLDSYLKLKQYLQLSPEELNKFDITTKAKDDLIKKENRILIKQGEQLLFSLSLFWAIVLTLIAGLVIFIFILTVLLALRPKYRKRFLLKMFK
jgi:tetratricopeptide (TPR) repeat protein